MQQPGLHAQNAIHGTEDPGRQGPRILHLAQRPLQEAFLPHCRNANQQRPHAISCTPTFVVVVHRP